MVWAPKRTQRRFHVTAPRVVYSIMTSGAVPGFACGERCIRIPDTDHLCRRFIDDPNHITWDGERPIPHPMSDNSFNMEKGRHGLSTSWRQHIQHHLLGLEVILDGDPRYTLVGEISVTDARAIGMRVDHDPTGDKPIDCAHTSVDWPLNSLAQNSDRPPSPERKLIKNRLATSFRFVHGEVQTPRPDGA